VFGRRIDNELRDHRLHESGRLLRTCFSDADQSFDELGLASDPLAGAAGKATRASRLSVCEIFLFTSIRWKNSSSTHLRTLEQWLKL